MIGIIPVAVLVDHDRLKEPDLIVMKQYMLFHPADFSQTVLLSDISFPSYIHSPLDCKVTL